MQSQNEALTYSFNTSTSHPSLSNFISFLNLLQPFHSNILQLPEEVELIWDDSVAPETALDLDAPHVDTKEVLAMFFGAFIFFGMSV